MLEHDHVQAVPVFESRLPAGRPQVAAHTLRTALILTAIWRVCIAVAQLFAYHALAVAKNYHSLLGHQWPANPLTIVADSGVRLDAYWYASAAEHGYHYDPHYISSIGYFPLFPVLLKLVSFATGNVFVAGNVIATGALFASILALHAWLDSKGLAHKSAWVTALLLSFPFSFFFAAMFTESLYLALSLVTFVAAERQRWTISSIASFLAVLTRPTGIALVPALLVLAWTRRSKAGIAPAASAVGAIIAFALYQWVDFGTPLAYVHTHAAPPTSVNLHQVLSDVTLHSRPGMPSWYLAFMLFWAVLFLALVPLVYRRFGQAYALYAGLSVLLPLSSSLPGMERYVVVIFPVFAALGSTRRRTILFVFIVAGFWLNMLFAGMFARGYGLF